MTTVIRIPLPVHNLHALAGFYTDGPSFAALAGLVARLDLEADLGIKRFGLVVEHYASRLNENVKTGTDGLSGGDRKKDIAITPYRYAEMMAALYVETDDFLPFEMDEVFSDISNVVSALRVQGGPVADFIGDKRYPLHYKQIAHAGDLHQFVVAHERPLSYAYLTRHLSSTATGSALVDEYAKVLSEERSAVLVCNGYLKVGELEGHTLAETNYTLATLMQVYQMKKQGAEAIAEFERTFFWQFDADALTHHNLFIVS